MNFWQMILENANFFFTIRYNIFQDERYLGIEYMDTVLKIFNSIKNIEIVLMKEITSPNQSSSDSDHKFQGTSKRSSVITTHL